MTATNMTSFSPKNTQDIAHTPSGSACTPTTPPSRKNRPLIASNYPCLVISGPSGVGKGTLIKHLLDTKKKNRKKITHSWNG